MFPVAGETYQGPQVAVWFLALCNVAGTARSLVHILASDSGAESIATIPVHVTGGPNIVALLAQWGGGQLVMALVIWVVLWRHRALVPLMLAATAMEHLARIAIAQLKPLTTIGTPPGALGSRVLLPLCLLMLLLSLTRRGAAVEPSR